MMKKVRKSDDLRPEYRREDLGKGIRGKYYQAYQESAALRETIEVICNSEESLKAAVKAAKALPAR